MDLVATFIRAFVAHHSSVLKAKALDAKLVAHYPASHPFNHGTNGRQPTEYGQRGQRVEGQRPSSGGAERGAWPGFWASETWGKSCTAE